METKGVESTQGRPNRVADRPDGSPAGWIAEPLPTRRAAPAEAPMTRIVPVRTGWDPHPGGPPWYPDDLPPEWRLGFFAHAFWGVLVPSRQWRGADAATAAAWAADTPARFRFYLELDRPPSPPTAGGACPGAGPFAALGGRPVERVAVPLGGRLGGLVEPARGTSGTGPSRSRRVLTPAGAPHGLAWEVPGAAIRDPRAARRWIEGHAPLACDGPVLALLGPCGWAELGQWQTLCELLGFA